MGVSPFDAVVFDLDHTIATPEQSAEMLYEGAFERADLPVVGDPEDLWSALAGPPPAEDERAFLAAGFQRVLAQYDHDGDSDALAAGFLDVVDYGAVSFVPGAREALDAAAEAGLVGLLTNGPERRQQPKLRTLQLESTFDAVVYAADLGFRKPDSRPFEHAIDLLGTSPERTLYVGNSLEYDVGGAQAAGWPVAWYRADGESDPGEYDPEFVLDSLADLAEVLR